MPFAEASDGIRLYFEEHGAGEPLLLLAGQGQDHRQWDLVRDAYAARHRVIVYDYRGLGRSDAPSEPPYTTRGQAEDAVAVLDHLGIERAHVFGVSMGGRVAQWLGIDHGARLGALVLGCTTPGDRHGIPRTAEVQQVLERTLASDEPPEGAAVLALLSLMFSPGWVNANIEVVQAMAAQRADPVPEFVRRWHFQASQAHDAWELLPTITAPTLVLHGSDDQVSPSANARLLAGRVPGAELQLVEGGRHGFFLEFGEETARLALGFLGSHPLGDAHTA